MKIEMKPYHYKRYRGWDFLPTIDSWQIYGKPDYDYKHFYSMTFGLKAFRYAAGVTVNITRKNKELK